MTHGDKHPLAGRPQSPEHIEKRKAAVAAAKAAWSQEKRELVAKSVSESNKRRNAAAVLAKHCFKTGSTPWNKGNDWRTGLSPDEVRAKAADWARKRRASDPQFKLHGRVSALVRFTLKRAGSSKGGKSWTRLLGYTVAELEAHLKQKIPAGYTWDDYLAGRLELDHKVPVSVHNFRDASDPDFARCWALSNLQLLPKRVNLEKRARLAEPFQPSLSFAA